MQPDYATKDPSNLLLGQPDGTFVEARRGGRHRQLRPRARRGARRPQPRRPARPGRGQLSARRCRVWRNVGVGHGRRARADGPLARRTGSRQPGGNRDAIGAWSRSQVGDTVIGRRELTVGGGHVSGQLGWTHFGLGPATRGARSASPWPDGERAVAARRRGPVRDHRARRGRAASRGRRRSPDAVAPMTTRAARLARIDLPDFGMPGAAAGAPAAIYPARLERSAARGRARATTGSWSTPTASTAPTSSFLTGFDPRFEEAILVVGPDDEPADPRRQRVLRHGRRRAAADAPRAVPGPQPARASRATGRGRCRHPRRRRASGAGSRVGVARLEAVRDRSRDRRAGVPRRRAARRWPGASGACRERQRPADRPGRRAAGRSTRSTSSRRSSTPPARRRAASARCSPASGRA